MARRSPVDVELSMINIFVNNNNTNKSDQSRPPVRDKHHSYAQKSRQESKPFVIKFETEKIIQIFQDNLNPGGIDQFTSGGDTSGVRNH